MQSVMEKQVRAVETSVSAQEVLRPLGEVGTNLSSVSSAGIWSAHAPRALWGGTRVWVAEFAKRVAELGALRDGWDAGNAVSLRPAAVRALIRALTDLDDFIQSAPAVSIRDDGGLLCSWENEMSSLDIDADAQGQLSIYFQDHAVDSEWEGSLAGALSVEKWLWQASA